MKHCVLITGASSGIGEALAYEFAKKGYNLYLIARRKDKLEAVSQKVKTLSKNADIEVQYKRVDLLSAKERRALCDDITHNHKLDILVNNAGFGVHGFFEDIDSKRHLDMIETNISALVDLTQQLLGHMQRENSNEAQENSKDERFIVNIASVGAFQPGAFYAVYFATKAFVLSFSEALNEEMKRKARQASVPRVHVSAVCPGPTQSEFFTQAGMNPEDNSVIAKMFAKSPTSEALAQYVVKRVLKKKVVIIHGRLFSFLIFIQRFMSRTMVRRLTATMQETRMK